MTDISLASQHPSQPSAAPEPYVPARRTFAPGYLPACIRVKRRCSSVDILAWPPARVLRRTSTNQGNLGRRMIRRARSTADDRGRVRVMRRPGVVTATRRRMPIASIACLPRRGGPSAGCICRCGRSVSRSGGPPPGTGLVEPGHLAGGELSADVLQEPSSRPGRAGCQRRDHPGEHGMPNSSPSASAVRSLDRNCPAYR